MSSFDAEVIVAGAGPAGAVAARTLALAGIDTLLVERGAFPRNKPCGGGISGRALVRFPWLAKALEPIEVTGLSKVHVESPDGTSLDVMSTDPSVLLVRRLEFDHALVNAATAAGARLDERFEITQVDADSDGVTLKARDNRRKRAPIVVAADGVHSVIAKRLGVNRAWGSKAIAIDMMEETPLETLRAVHDDVLWISYAYNGLEGYSYIFPKARHTNVGLGCLVSHFKSSVPASPYQFQREFVDKMVAEGRLVGRSDRKHFTPYLIPLAGPLPQAYSGRVLFVGDAGGFVNAFTAEGIYYGMISGELAGQAIAKDRRKAGAKYEQLWRKELGVELRDSVLIQKYLFGHEGRVNKAMRAATALPWLTTILLDFTRGDVSYAALRRKLLAKFPRAAMRLAGQKLRKWGNAAMGQ